MTREGSALKAKSIDFTAFSIIIPTRGRTSQILETLKEIEEMSYPRKRFEVIVVVNDTTKIQTAIQKYIKSCPYQISIILEKRIGPASARNTGVQLAKYTHCIFWDDDGDKDPDLLIKYHEAWEQFPQAKVIGGPVEALYPTDNWWNRYVLRSVPWCFGHLDYGDQCKKLKLGELVYTSNMSVFLTSEEKKKEVFPSPFGVGSPIFKSYVLGAEDYFLCTNEILKNNAVWYVPSLMTTNKVSKNRFYFRYLLKRNMMTGVELYLLDTFFKDIFLASKRKFFFKNMIYPYQKQLSSPWRNKRFWEKSLLSLFLDQIIILSYLIAERIIFYQDTEGA